MEGSVMWGKYYIVSTKCGHVGRKNYITIDFPVKASSSKEASKKVRQFPRVKRHRKDVIENVEEVDREIYNLQKMKNHQDPYLKARSKQEQNRLCKDLELRIKKHHVVEDEDYYIKRQRRVNYLMKKRAIERKLSPSF